MGAPASTNILKIKVQKHQIKQMNCPKSSTKAIPINCFVSHHPTNPLFFKVPFKEKNNIFFEISVKKKVFNLKELYYFEILF